MSKQIICLAFLLILFGPASIAQQAPSSSQVTAIRAGRLVDVDAGRVLTNQIILMRGGKIEAISEHVVVPAGATLVDLSKMTVLPGMID